MNYKRKRVTERGSKSKIETADFIPDSEIREDIQPLSFYLKSLNDGLKIVSEKIVNIIETFTK